MRIVHYAVLHLVLCFCLALFGCSSDPFREMAMTPPDSSSLYWGPSDPAPALEPPRLTPSLEDGPLSLAECMWIALQNNAKTRVSWYGTQAAAAAVGQARSTYLPQLNFQAAAEREKVQNLAPSVTPASLFSSRSATFGVRQLLLDGGERRATVQAGEAALRGADFQHNAVLLDLAVQTEASYYRLLAAQSLMNVADEAVRQRTKHFELAQAKADAGAGRQVDVLQAKAEKADAELTLVETRNQARLARGQLASAMGLSASAPVEVQQIPEQAYSAERRDVEALMELAAANRPSLKAAVAEVTRARRALEAQRAGRWPELSAAASYGWRDAHSLPDKRVEWLVGLNLTFPIFTGFQRTYTIRRAEAELKQALSSYEKQFRDVELEVWEAYSNILRAEEALKAADVFVESARESLSGAESGYREGRATIVELIDAQTALTKALNRKISAGLEWHLAIAQLERAVGKSKAFDSQLSGK